MKFPRERKEALPVVAICYDFDKTLSPADMQAQGFIQSVGFDVEQFWEESDAFAVAHDMDENLAYMYKMVREAEGHFVFSRAALMDYGAKVALFPGVNEWFDRLRLFGEENGAIVEHYIISSGLKEMIEGTEPAKRGAFKKIYASSFCYNDRGIAVWPAQMINFTNKTQFLFRIEKGILDVNDPGVNEYFPPDQLRVPFRNMIYIGDSDTDIPCMKLVNTYGGFSVGVYDPEKGNREKVFRMMQENRIRYFAPADYREGSRLDSLIKDIVLCAAAREKVENAHAEASREIQAARNEQTAAPVRPCNLNLITEKNDMEKTDAIIVLGHRLLPGNLPSDDLKRRIDKAVEVWRETGAPLIMPCGGLTYERQRTEAEVMREMLMERGVPEDVIRLEDQSRITLENMLNAYALLGPDKRVAVVSSDYHMDMALNDCRAVGLNAYGVGAETPDTAYRDEMRARLNGFEEKLDELRAQGLSNRQIIDQFMEQAKEAHQKGVKLEDDLHRKS